ncbi:MAG: ABC transporter permease subunit [Planctomycetota bacterium]
MSAAVVRKILREVGPLLLVLAAAATVFEMLYVFFVRQILSETIIVREFLPRLLEHPIVSKLMASSLGAQPEIQVSATGFMTIGFSHPLLHAFTWTLLLTIGTRTLVGEIDRGTADLLLALPVSRARVYLSSSLVLLVAALTMALAPIAGAALGQWLIVPPEPLNLPRLWLLVANIAALNVAIGGLTLLSSSWFSRRGPAVGAVLGVLLLSVLLQVLGPFWFVAHHLRFLGILYYYHPLPPIRSGELPAHDILVLLCIAVIAWTAGLLRFRARDIPAV